MVLLRVLVLFLKGGKTTRDLTLITSSIFYCQTQKFHERRERNDQNETVRLCHFAQGSADDLLTKAVD